MDIQYDDVPEEHSGYSHSHKIGRGDCLLFGGFLAMVMGFIACEGGLGSNGLTVEHSFRYNGLEGKVMKDDRRLTPNDTYWIELGGIRINDGQVVTDDKKVIVVNSEGYKVNEYKK